MGRLEERERGGGEEGKVKEGGSVTFVPTLTLDNSRDNRRSSQSHGTKLLQKGLLHMNILGQVHNMSHCPIALCRAAWIVYLRRTMRQGNAT